MVVAIAAIPNCSFLEIDYPLEVLGISLGHQRCGLWGPLEDLGSVCDGRWGPEMRSRGSLEVEVQALGCAGCSQSQALAQGPWEE